MAPGDYPLAVIAWCVAALALGGFVKGVVGVGIPMFAVPLMSLVIAPYQAAALVVLPVLPANLVQMRAGPPLAVKVARFWPLVLGLSLGTVLGGWWYTGGDPRVVQAVVGMLVLASLVVRAVRVELRIAPQREPWVGFLAGALAGALGGMAMLVGPLVVMYMSALRLDRESFVGGIAFVYLVTTLAITGALAGYGQLDRGLLIASALSSVPALAGLWLGTRLRQRIAQALFERLLDGLLAVMALSLLWKALA